MMGHGKLFAAATDATIPRPLSTLIMHQCPRFSHDPTGDDLVRPAWGWASSVWELIESKAVQAGLWSKSAVNTIVLGLSVVPEKVGTSSIRARTPEARANPRGLPSGFDHVVCARDLLVDPGHVAQYLGPNRPGVVSEWRAHMRERLSNYTLGARSLGEARTATVRCASQLRVALWQRPASGPRGRHLHNVEQIRRLVATYTPQPIIFLTATSTTTFAHQVANFRSFDVLITPHGSHLTNMIFAPPSAIFIEVVTMHVDDAPCRNGRAFAQSWLMAYGRHLPLRVVRNNSIRLTRAAPPPHMRPNVSSVGVPMLPTQPLGLTVDWPRANRMVAVHSGRDARSYRRSNYLEASLAVDMGTLAAALERAITIACTRAARRFECGVPQEAKRNASIIAPRTTLCCSPCAACIGSCDAVCPISSVYSCPRSSPSTVCG